MTIFWQPIASMGTPTSQILIRHVLPNIMAPLIIIFSINVGGVIISEASLELVSPFGLPCPSIQPAAVRDCSRREGRQYMEIGAMAGTLAGVWL